MVTPAELQVLLNGPALVAPPGTTYQFANPPNLNLTSFIVIGICIFGAVLAVCMRIYTKLAIIGTFVMEDYFLLVGVTMFLTYSGVAIEGVLRGTGIHQWDIQVKNLRDILYYLNVGSILYGDTITVIKISILLQYLRIFAPLRKMNLIYVGSWCIIWSMIIFFTIATLLEIFACTPRDKYWNVLITAGHCLNTNALNVAAATMTSLSDIFILLLPQHSIWKLQMSRKRKLAISGVFLTGALACLTSIVRLVYTVKLLKTGDVTYTVVFVGLWSEAEMAVGIICCCLPVLPKFLQFVGPKLSEFLKGSFSTSNFLKPINVFKTPKKCSANGSKPNTSWKSPYDSQNRLNGAYKTLESYELHIVGKKKNIITESIDELSKTVSDALASEQRGIRVAQTYEIDSLPVGASMPDLEKQQRVSPTHTGW